MYGLFALEKRTEKWPATHTAMEYHYYMMFHPSNLV